MMQGLAQDGSTTPSKLLGLPQGSLEALITDQALWLYARGTQAFQLAIDQDRRERERANQR